MTPWIIAIAIASILIKAAHGAQQRAENSMTTEGAQTGVYLMTFLAVAAMAFVLTAVVLAK